MKEGTYGIKLYFNVVDQDNEILDLAGATSIKMFIQQGLEVLTFDCVVENENEGLISYTTTEDDKISSKVGKDKIEVEIKFEGQCFINENKIREPILKRIKETV